MLVDGDYLLLVNHINAKLWLPTGGHVEQGEHPRMTVIREAREELSVEARFLFQLPLFLTISDTVGLTAGHTDVSLWHVLRGDRKMTLEFDRAEFNSLRWFQKDNVPLERTDPHMEQFLAKLYP